MVSRFCLVSGSSHAVASMPIMLEECVFEDEYYKKTKIDGELDEYSRTAFRRGVLTL